MTKKQTTIEVDSVSVWDLPTNIDEMVSFWISRKEKHGSNVSINVFHSDDDCQIDMTVSREETDEEHACRVETEKRYSIYMKERDMKEFKRLRDLYGNEPLV